MAIHQLGICKRAHYGIPTSCEEFLSQGRVQLIIRKNSIGLAGSNELGDWFRNFDLARVPGDSHGRGQVHRGFKRFAEIVWNMIAPILPRYDSWTFSGHSLGASVIALVANRYYLGGGTVNGLWLYGCPAFGDEQYVQSFGIKNYYRVVNGEDVITHLPPLFYHHLPLEHKIGKKGLPAYLETLLHPKRTHLFDAYQDSLRKT